MPFKRSQHKNSINVVVCGSAPSKSVVVCCEVSLTKDGKRKWRPKISQQNAAIDFSNFSECCCMYIRVNSSVHMNNLSLSRLFLWKLERWTFPESFGIGPNKKRSLLRLTRPTAFWSADRTLFSTSLPILFGAAPCVASCVVDHDREREVDE